MFVLLVIVAAENRPHPTSPRTYSMKYELAPQISSNSSSWQSPGPMRLLLQRPGEYIECPPAAGREMPPPLIENKQKESDR